jgi:hypothetical protein
MASKPPPSHADIVRKVDSLRPDGTTDDPFADEDVTAVIDLAMERATVAQERTTTALDAAMKRLRSETQKTRELARRLTDPPALKR